MQHVRVYDTCGDNKFDYILYDVTCDTYLYTHRLTNAGEIRRRLIVSADCVSAAVIQNVTADMILHTLAHTVAMIAAYTDAFVAAVAG